VLFNSSLEGCGQVKTHRDGTHELASIVVRPAYQKRGTASAIIRHLIDQSTEPLYLACREELGLFYARFGFDVVPPHEHPPYFRRVWRIYSLLKQFLPLGGFLVMRRV